MRAGPALDICGTPPSFCSLLEAELSGGVFGLVGGETFVFELVNETGVGEGGDAEVGLGAFDGLLVPVGAAVVGGEDGVGVGVFFIFELLDEAAIGEGGDAEVGLGAAEGVFLAEGHGGRFRGGLDRFGSFGGSSRFGRFGSFRGLGGARSDGGWERLLAISFEGGEEEDDENDDEPEPPLGIDGLVRGGLGGRFGFWTRFGRGFGFWGGFGGCGLRFGFGFGFG